MIRKKGFSYSFDKTKCSSCGGKCCIGDSGNIFVTMQEIENIAKFLGIKVDSFIKQYTKKVGYKFSLIEKPHVTGKACIFFDDKNQCSIYEFRPSGCVSFPFWDMFKNNPEYISKECIGVILNDNDK